MLKVNVQVVLTLALVFGSTTCLDYTAMSCVCSQDSYLKLQNLWGETVWRGTSIEEKAAIFDVIFYEMDKFLPGIKRTADTAGRASVNVSDTELLLYRIKGLHWYDMAINMLHDFDLLKANMAHYMWSHPGWGAPGPLFLSATRRAFSSIMGKIMGPEAQIISNSCFHTIHKAYLDAGKETRVEAECCVNCKQNTEGVITGKISISQRADGSPVNFHIKLSGFSPGDREKLHGFHVHEHGLLGNDCKDAGGHYNPLGLPHNKHGGRHHEIRHVGDLGNIYVGKDGTVDTTIVDSKAWIVGANSILNRALVIHADEDDLGQGNADDSKTTGHAGARIACCVIKHITYL